MNSNADITIAAAQSDVRRVYLNGAIGQAVSGAIWLASAACATWMGPRLAVYVVVIGGVFIFPLTTLVLRLKGGPASLPAGHPMIALAMQVAFIVPLTLPVIAWATLRNHPFFYPACMIVVGTHYMPFAFMYGMRSYLVLAGALIAGGVLFSQLAPHSFTPGGWFTGIVLVAFAVWAGALRSK